MKAEKPKWLAVEDIAHDLGVAQEDFESWLSTKQFERPSDHRKRLSVPETLKAEFANSSDYISCLKASIDSDSHGWIESKMNSDELRNDRIKILEKYEPYLKELDIAFKSIRPAVNFHGFETPVYAAYLLHSKAISCLKMLHENLISGYWVAGSIIREIGEATDMAEYFILSSDSDSGKRTLMEWYRQNRSPCNAVCREEISKRRNLFLNDDIEDGKHKYLMGELYQIKSKFVHSTFGVIREMTSFKVLSDGIDIDECSLGPIDNEFKLIGLAELYMSILWSVYQSFFLCFSKTLLLSENKKNRLIDIDSEFQNWRFI